MSLNDKIWICDICSKKYIRKYSYDKHILLCRFEKNKNTEQQDIPKISNEKLYLLLVELSNKYDKLQYDYDELKKYVVMKKKK